MSLREAVEAFAEANDLAFMPKPGRTHEGLQVYSFGKVSVVVDSAGEMLRASIGDRWAPVSLDQLLEAHKAKLRAKSKAF
jgi:tuftelin-interacting protein 11